MRRTIDVLIAIVMLPLLSPLFLLVSLAVALESPGNPFFGGLRVGKRGMQFRMWKFRTMIVSADPMGSAITTKYDPRVTTIGCFLRKTKIDELPQFFNLLLGDLTLIGPRPEDPGLAARYTPEQQKIFNVKPGITGPAQLKYTFLEAETIPEGHDAQQFYIDHVVAQKVRLDLDYLDNRTLWSDLKVLYETLLLVLRALSPFRGPEALQSEQPSPNPLP